METVIVIMLKNTKTGFFEKELTTIPITENEDLILNIYAILEKEQDINIHLKITTPKDVLDWEYDAIYDHYNLNIYEKIPKEILELEDEYNPTWEIILKYDNDDEILKQNIYNVLKMHKEQLDSVYQIIKDKKGEYEQDEE